MTVLCNLTRNLHSLFLGQNIEPAFFLFLDERFVVKEVSGIELKTFHDVSQQYFDYLISAARVQVSRNGSLFYLIPIL